MPNCVCVKTGYLHTKRLRKMILRRRAGASDIVAGKYRYSILLSLLVLTSFSTYAQTTPAFLGKRCGIEYNYDHYTIYGPDRDTVCTTACAEKGWVYYSPAGICQDPTPPLYTRAVCGWCVSDYICSTDVGYEAADANDSCPNPPDEDDGCGVNNTDNPCNVATGNKYRSETDFSGNGLSFTRAYNSNTLYRKGLGKGWRHNYQKSLIVSGDSLTAVSATGKGERWTKAAGVWSGDPDSDLAIIEDANGFEITKQNGVKENYDLEGRILTETDTNGYQTTYVYVGGNLDTVTNHYGRSITFTYWKLKMQTVTDSLGAVYRYEYDANHNLTDVVYPDTTPTDDTDNPRKTYLYENTTYPNHLTGIVDENGDRFGTYSYDANGKADLSEKGQTSNPVGQERIQLSY